MTPAFTTANATDWRTADGVRVKSAANAGLREFSVTFDNRVSPISGEYGFSTWTINSTGRFSYVPHAELVYDPIPKVSPLAAFWLVWTPYGTNPKFQHPTETSAVREAERLAKSNPNKEFFVLKMMAKSTIPDTPVQTTFSL